jgi:hypothetical protein
MLMVYIPAVAHSVPNFGYAAVVLCFQPRVEATVDQAGGSWVGITSISATAAHTLACAVSFLPVLSRKRWLSCVLCCALQADSCTSTLAELRSSFAPGFPLITTLLLLPLHFQAARRVFGTILGACLGLATNSVPHIFHEPFLLLACLAVASVVLGVLARPQRRTAIVLALLTLCAVSLCGYEAACCSARGGMKPFETFLARMGSVSCETKSAWPGKSCVGDMHVVPGCRTGSTPWQHCVCVYQGVLL